MSNLEHIEYLVRFQNEKYDAHSSEQYLTADTEAVWGSACETLADFGGGVRIIKMDHKAGTALDVTTAIFNERSTSPDDLEDGQATVDLIEGEIRPAIVSIKYDAKWNEPITEVEAA